MEFVSLRNLQRGRPEVWETLEREDGRVVLTKRGQPAYLLVDLKGHNVLTLVNKFDVINSELRVKPSPTLS